MPLIVPVLVVALCVAGTYWLGCFMADVLLKLREKRQARAGMERRHEREREEMAATRAAFERAAKQSRERREAARVAAQLVALAEDLERDLERQAEQRRRDEQKWDDDDVLAAMELDLIQRTPKREKQ